MLLHTLLVSLTLTLASGTAPTVQTTSGPILGLDLGGGKGYAYLGIPFATALRWGPPMPPTPWTTPLNATSYVAGCVQFSGSLPSEADTEECLTVNVWVPSTHSTGNPMIQWIHGGGFIGGNGEGDLSLYAEKTGAVIFSINYRLGALGYLALEGFSPAFPTPTDPSAACANVGLLDQQAALKWASANGAAFGADPTHTLLTGQSAGGSSVLFHLTLPGSYPTYRAALAQSPGSPTNTLEAGTATATAIALAVGCNATAGYPAQLACLRALPSATIVSAALAVAGTTNLPLTLGPVIDGALVKASPANALLAGDMNTGATVLVSECLFEGDSLLDGFTRTTVLTPPQVYQALQQFGLQVGFNQATTASLGEAYAALEVAEGSWNYMSRIWGDGLIACSAYWASKGSAIHSTKPSYRLLFNTTLPGQPYHRATHGTDNDIIFGGAVPAVSEDVWAFLANVAVSGDPNVGPFQPSEVWPPTKGQGGADFLAVTELHNYTLITGWQEEYCDSLWLPILP